MKQPVRFDWAHSGRDVAALSALREAQRRVSEWLSEDAETGRRFLGGFDDRLKNGRFGPHAIGMISGDRADAGCAPSARAHGTRNNYAHPTVVAADRGDADAMRRMIEAAKGCRPNSRRSQIRNSAIRE